jgi:hypothetical protein
MRSGVFSKQKLSVAGICIIITTPGKNEKKSEKVSALAWLAHKSKPGH